MAIPPLVLALVCLSIPALQPVVAPRDHELPANRAIYTDKVPGALAR